MTENQPLATSSSSQLTQYASMLLNNDVQLLLQSKLSISLYLPQPRIICGFSMLWTSYEYESLLTALSTNNNGSIDLTTIPRISERSKHIDVSYHHVRDLAESGKLTVLYIPSHDNLADLCTKPLSSLQLSMLRDSVLGKELYINIHLAARQSNNTTVLMYLFLIFFSFNIVFISFLMRLISLYLRFAKERLGLLRMRVRGVLKYITCHSTYT